MKKSEKSFFVDNLTQELNSASLVVLIDHTGLSVKMQQDLKNRLKGVSAKMNIVKNTLFKLAGGKAGSPKEILEDTILSGPTAIIISEGDPIAPLQVIARFAKEFEIPNLKVGIVEGKFQNKDTLLTLANLPSKDVLYAQSVGAISAPLYGLINTLQGNMQKLLYILDAKSKEA